MEKIENKELFKAFANEFNIPLVDLHNFVKSHKEEADYHNAVSIFNEELKALNNKYRDRVINIGTNNATYVRIKEIKVDEYESYIIISGPFLKYSKASCDGIYCSPRTTVSILGYESGVSKIETVHNYILTRLIDNDTMRQIYKEMVDTNRDFIENTFFNI